MILDQNMGSKDVSGSNNNITGILISLSQKLKINLIWFYKLLNCTGIHIHVFEHLIGHCEEFLNLNYFW